MIVPDANILIYAHDSSVPQHARARAWWEKVLNRREPIGLPWVVVLAFTRLMTSLQICANPLTTGQVREIVLLWLSCPHVRLLQVSEQGLERLFDLLEEAGSGGRLSTDALIAVTALEHSATVYSNDRDFDRFGGVRRIDPLGRAAEPPSDVGAAGGCGGKVGR
jgi:toxin-antitoxin system PIN domain toxin